MNIGNKHVKKQDSQWSCGAQYRCVRLKSWRTGMDLQEGLYQNATADPIQINATEPVLDTKMAAKTVFTPPENAILTESEKLLQLQIQQDTIHYEALKQLMEKHLVTIQHFTEQIAILTLQNQQLTRENESLKTSL
jgi:hypothetical protein